MKMLLENLNVNTFPKEDKVIIDEAIQKYNVSDMDFGEEFQSDFKEPIRTLGDRIGRRYPKKILEIPIEFVAFHEVLLRRIQHNFSVNPKWKFDQEFSVFIRYLLFLTNQSYGSKLESYFMQNCKKINAGDEMGDRYNYFGQVVEVKTSIITEFSRSVNFNYIRPWQNIDKYMIFVIDNGMNNELFLFELSAKQMKNELIILNARPVNGTKKINEENKKEGLKISFKFSNGSNAFKRWIEHYRIKNVTYFLNPHGFNSSI